MTVRQRPGALAQGVVQGPQRVRGVVGEQLDGQLGGAVTDVDEVLEQLTGRRGDLVPGADQPLGQRGDGLGVQG